ncbi:MAG: hypothetical protein AB198_00425 [Parcubacteria bacterium C7867-003]|nr:MAG: hypothetical protein AB198_00425 [Parcubacteria bacterium C7867-003]
MQKNSFNTLKTGSKKSGKSMSIKPKTNGKAPRPSRTNG